MIPVKIIGMGLGPDDLTQRHRRFIAQAEILVGGRRHLLHFKEHPAEKIVIVRDVKALAGQIAHLALTKTVVVLASGDPLFYGIGKVFADVLGKEHVEVYPNVTSVAGAFARLKESWDDAGVISLHGKSYGGDLVAAIQRHDKVAVFTDPKNNPAELAGLLYAKGLDNYKICVLEQLGSEDELVRWYSLEDAAKQHFNDPNMVVLQKNIEDPLDEQPLEQECPVRPLSLGMPDDCFAHRQGLITKSEIRVVSLSKLCLEAHHVMWDLGAGSGSVSIEASAFIKQGRIFAVEQHEERIADIRENIRRFGVSNVTPVMACLPEGLTSLPDPDRIFIGGGGKDLETILNTACDRLKPCGVIVMNTVLLGNVNTALTTLEKRGFETDIVQIQVSTGQAMPWNLMLKGGNPVFIIRGSNIKKQ